MSVEAPNRLHIEGISESWFRPAAPPPGDEAALYRPAALIQCKINFRSLRAGLNHSEERTFTAWLPEGDLPIDWDTPATLVDQHSQLAFQPEPGIGYKEGNYQTTLEGFDQYQAELIDLLVRKERLRIFFNPVFGLFSDPADSLEDFLPQIAEAALGRVEPEMKRLRNRFELQLEQIREAHRSKVSNLDEINLEKFISHRLHLFISENRLADMFSTLAGSVFGTTEPRSEQPSADLQEHETELREDLERVEQEASEALRALYSEYLTLANEHDVFEIGLQPDNIKVIRRMLLWVPESGE